MHLPRYLAEFKWRFNRRFDLEGILGHLLRADTLTPPMPQRLLVLTEVGRKAGPTFPKEGNTSRGDARSVGLRP